MAINDTLFDLLNKWKTDILTDNSSVGDTKDYVNQMYALLPMLVNQSLVLSDTVLKREDSWDNVNVNTLHYFEDLGVEGSPDSSMIKRQAGYLIYVKSSVSSLGLQVCITEDLHILYRLAPKGTWIMNANDSAITSLSERLSSFETQVNQNGLDALNLRVEALRRQVGAVTGDKIKEVSDGLDELSKVVSQKVDVYKSRQLLTDILNNNDVTIYDDGKQLLAPTIAVEGNNKVIAYNISSNNLPSEVKGYQVETSTDKSKWSIHTETVDSGNLLSMINGTKYYVRALALPVDASDRTQSNYSDIVEVTVGTNKTAKTPEKPVPTQYPRTSKTVTPSDVFALASDLKSAVNTINKEKATTGYVDSGLNNLQSKITDIQNTLSSKVDNLQIGGRNYVLNSNEKIAFTGTNIVGQVVHDWSLSPDIINITSGSTVTISYDVLVTNADTGKSFLGMSSPWKVLLSRITYKSGMNHISLTLKLPRPFVADEVLRMSVDNTKASYVVSNFKLEQGSIATDWTPAPEDVQASITNALSDVKTQVDNSAVGTNLLLDSKTQMRQPSWSTNNSNWSQNWGTYLGSNIYRARYAWDNARYSYKDLLDRGVINTTDDFTYSVYFRVVGEDPAGMSYANIYFQSYATTKNATIPLQLTSLKEGQWVRIVVPFKFIDFKYDPTKEADQIYIRKYSIRLEVSEAPKVAGAYYEYAAPKLEVGPTATDYSLNPADIATNDGVQAINDEIMKKADKTELANYLKPWMGTQEEYDAISPHDPNTLYMIVEPTTTTTTTTTKAS